MDISNNFVHTTQETETEIALRQSQQRLQEAQRIAHIGNWEIDVATQITIWSEEVFRIFGLEPRPEAPPPHEHKQQIHPDDLLVWQKKLEQAIAQPTTFNFDLRIYRPDGSLRYLNIIGESQADESGQVIKLVGTVMDISERKQAEIALQQVLQQTDYQSCLLQAVLNSTPDWIFAKDTNFRYILASRSYAAAIGKTVEEILGKDDLELGFSEELVFGNSAKGIRGFRADDRTALAGKPVCNSFDPATIADGSLRIFDIRKNPLYDLDGKVFGVLGLSRDLTERYHAEEAMRRSEAQLKEKAEELTRTLQELQQTQMQMIHSEKMSSLGQLVAGVAHEINNPVNFIHGNLSHANQYSHEILELLALYQKHYPIPHLEIQKQAEAIDLEFIQQDLLKLLSSMRVGTERIQSIVASLRTFSRMDESEMKKVNIHDGIDSTLMILQHKLKGKSSYPQIQVIKEYGDLPLVECYPGQLNQVFMNILSNAIDALEEAFSIGFWSFEGDEKQNNSPQIYIRTEVIHNQVFIHIADNGLGMTENIRQRIFDPFFTTKPVGKGTGMGLSISYQIVTEKHDGSLYCVSKPDLGTEFILQIPLKQK
ncbi:PAS domain-containing sensor histidine kinase [Scytonema hofmannii PCC 7110]|uniref:histidine kinase n=1 Tax=Scytonema hofmannii PCC 7110 TaxID=128403 RepID=A0A139WRG8_9CYAN|nr:PAS domain-containing protein [Scytonema hofmannii]KYC35028.1 PAS domain-containing sensor histidine kinase [Scytonema hofmannii PCC 7110]